MSVLRDPNDVGVPAEQMLDRLWQRVAQLEGKNQELMSELSAAQARNVELAAQYNTLNAYMNKLDMRLIIRRLLALRTRIAAARRALES